MAIGSRINPNFPIPGIDQSSRGFRDNFATTKREIEQIQGTTIQLSGAVVSDPLALGSSETGVLIIETAINGSVVSLAPPNHAIQYNQDGLLTGNAGLVYSAATATVGIGTSTPDASTRLHAAGPIRARSNVAVDADPVEDRSGLTLSSSTNQLKLLNQGSNVSLGASGSVPMHLLTADQLRVTLDQSGNVGIGTGMPLSTLEVHSNLRDLARFVTDTPLTDSMVRMGSTAASGTVGWGLELVPANYVGGLRMDAAGTVSLHTGESSGAQLSTSSARLSISSTGNVGIGTHSPIYTLEVNGQLSSTGITDASDEAIKRVGINNTAPDYELDVRGDVAISGGKVCTAPQISVDDAPTAIDVWPMTTYRMARYQIQVVAGTIPSEEVDIIDCVVAHANLTPALKIIDVFNLGGGLGSLSVGVDPIDPTYAVLYYTGVLPGNRVRVSKSYLLD